MNNLDFAALDNMGSATQPVGSTAWSTVARFYVSFCIRNSVLIIPQYLGYAFSVHSSLIYPVPCHLLLLSIGPNMSLIQIHCLSSPDSDPYPVPHLACFFATQLTQLLSLSSLRYLAENLILCQHQCHSLTLILLHYSLSMSVMFSLCQFHVTSSCISVRSFLILCW